MDATIPGIKITVLGMQVKVLGMKAFFNMHQLSPHGAHLISKCSCKGSQRGAD